MAGENTRRSHGGTQKMNLQMGGEKTWTATLVIVSLVLLVLVRHGFRGVSAFGARASLG